MLLPSVFSHQPAEKREGMALLVASRTLYASISRSKLGTNMSASESLESGLVCSDDDDVRPVVRVAKWSFVVLLIADDTVCVKGLSKRTQEVLLELGGAGDAAQPRQMLGFVHLRWSLASSAPVVGPLAWVREMGSLRRSVAHVSHWIDYEVINAEWFGRAVPENQRLCALDQLDGMRPSGDFTVWGALGRCVVSGAAKHVCSVPVNDESTRRLTGAPGCIPKLGQVRHLLASVDTYLRPIALTQVPAYGDGHVYSFMDPLGIIRFLISTRHLRSITSVAQDSERLEAAFGDGAIAPAALPPSRTFVAHSASAL